MSKNIWWNKKNVIPLHSNNSIKIMATLSMFYGIIISMFFRDNRRHHLPHIHVSYQDDNAIFSIPEGNLIEGKLKPVQMKLVQAWIALHADELFADWTLAIDGKQVYKIEPLR
jgi:hypothetical protein